MQVVGDSVVVLNFDLWNSDSVHISTASLNDSCGNQSLKPSTGRILLFRLLLLLLLLMYIDYNVKG
jgi:hypothetical protein